MTLTINKSLYSQLLAKFQPQIIRNEIEHERAIMLCETLANKTSLTLEENEILELLITLIEKFESENYSLGNSSNPRSRLLFLIENNQLSDYDLAEIFGSKENYEQFINGKQKITQELAFKLAQRFNLNANLFWQT